MAAHKGPDPAVTARNWRIERYLIWSWVAIIGVCLVYRMSLRVSRYLRHITCMGNEKQSYFRRPNQQLATLRRLLIEAPLFSKRHRAPFMPSSSITLGSPPSRLQTILILGYIALNVACLTVEVNWKTGGLHVNGELLIQRSGGLAVMNMLPLFLLAGRNNPLIPLLGIPFNTYNLLHRWIGRIVVLHVIVHAVTWLFKSVHDPLSISKGWPGIKYSLGNVPWITAGLISAIGMVVILLQSIPTLRSASYEVFLHVHILVALTVVVTLYLHLAEYPTYRHIVLATITVWAVERCLRVWRIVSTNVGSGGTKAEIEVIPGDAMRITLHMARPWRFKPGQFVYLYIPSIGWWTSHPFSLAWSDEEHKAAMLTEKGLPITSFDEVVVPKSMTSMSLIIRRRNGFTNKLWRKAISSPTGVCTVSAIVEGPYGGHNLDSYGTVMLFAAGVGITHQMPYIRHLVAGYANETTATRKLTLVWILQNPEHLDWVRPWMEPILAMDRRRDVLKIMLFITRPRSTKEIRSPSQTVMMFPGRPCVDTLIAKEQTVQEGAMAVSVCGTGSLSDEVRESCRHRAHKTNIDFVDHLFSW